MSDDRQMRSTAEGRLFGKFFADIPRCLGLLRETCTVVSGSAVLHAFEQSLNWEPDCLDFYMNDRYGVYANGLDLWHEYLSAEEYSVAEQLDDSGCTGLQFFEYENKVNSRKVYLDVVRGKPIRHILCQSWSTHLMNFATWEAIYSCFPRSTFRQKHVALLNCEREVRSEAFDKYVESGFSYVPYESCGSKDLNDERRVGDDMSFRIPFSGGSKEVPEGLSRVRFRVVKREEFVFMDCFDDEVIGLESKDCLRRILRRIVRR